jgi:hypothetical protein
VLPEDCHSHPTKTGSRHTCPRRKRYAESLPFDENQGARSGHLFTHLIFSLSRPVWWHVSGGPAVYGVGQCVARPALLSACGRRSKLAMKVPRLRAWGHTDLRVVAKRSACDALIAYRRITLRAYRPFSRFRASTEITL